MKVLIAAVAGAAIASSVGWWLRAPTDCACPATEVPPVSWGETSRPAKPSITPREIAPIRSVRPSRVRPAEPHSDAAAHGASRPTVLPADTATADPHRVLAAIESGGEDERVDALRPANGPGVVLPSQSVLQVLRNDPSARVRAAAFAYLMQLPGIERSVIDEAIGVAARDAEPELRREADDVRANLDQLAIAQAEADAIQGAGAAR